MQQARPLEDRCRRLCAAEFPPAGGFTPLAHDARLAPPVAYSRYAPLNTKRISGSGGSNSGQPRTHTVHFTARLAVFKSTTFKKYLLPGFVFQSVVIAGGYGTGRELVEFFLGYGPLGGLMAMVLVSTVIWSAVCASSFEFARLYRSYDYRTFFTHLLGPGWLLFEVCYFLLLLLILAVIAAAAGTVLQETFDLPYASGVLAMMAAVGYLVFRGSATIERVLAGWSFVLYSVYVLLFVWSLARFGGATLTGLTAGQVTSGWMVGGVRYAAYNLAIIPAVLFAVRHAQARKEAVTAGLLTGPIAILPGLMFYLVMCGQYPEILGRAVPANFILELLGSRTFQIVFQIVLFGTLIETGTGLVHAVNERVAGAFAEKNRPMPTFLRPLTALILLVLGTLLSGFGLIELIAKGYGTLTWFFLAIFVIPMLTYGIWKISYGKGD